MDARPGVKPVERRRAWRVPTFTLIAATILSFWCLVAVGVNAWDEAWFLHVTDRVLHGETLYAQVRYFPTPLAIYIATGAARLGGAEIVVMKALLALAFGGTVAAGSFIIRFLAPDRATRALLILLLFGFALPFPLSLYNGLAITFLMVTAALVLHWDSQLRADSTPRANRRLDRTAAFVGVAAGACFLTKYNLGAAVAIAVAGSFAVPLAQGRLKFRNFLRYGVIASGTWVMATLAGLAPVLFGGAGEAFWHQVLDGTSQLKLPHVRGRSNATFGDLVLRFDLKTAQLIVIAAAVLIGATAIAGSHSAVRGRLIVAALFLAAAATMLTSGFADHTFLLMPPALVLLVGSAAQLRNRLTTFGPAISRGMTITALVLASGASVIRPAQAAIISRHSEVLTAAHFRGAFVEPRRWDEIQRNANEIRGQVSPGHKVFILSLEAGMYYLVGGLQNPTPYDFPDRPEFGSGGVADVEKELTDGTIRFSCIDNKYPPDLLPVAVIDAIHRHARLIAKLHLCDLWLSLDRFAPRN